ncbi:MAG: hypothetical protein Q9M20_08810 [Mariprofundaceae bacterium]|nr:hypothetical protein [Mariprofundaceae bacterium]
MKLSNSLQAAGQQTTAMVNPFHPFGFGVRMCSDNPTLGMIDLAANLSDLCAVHGASYEDAKALDYPSGSVVLLFSELYLAEAAHNVFSLFINEVQHEHYL